MRLQIFVRNDILISKFICAPCTVRKEPVIRLSEMPRNKKIMLRVGLIALLVIVLIGAGVGVALMVRSLTAGKGVAFLSGVKDFKNSYYVGDELVLYGTVRATYEDGRVEVVPITGDMVEGFDSSEPGMVNVTITYKDAYVEVPVTFTPLRVRSISIDESTRPEVVYRGVPFPLGMYINAIMIDDTTRHVPVTSSMIKGFDEFATGEQQVTITYLNATLALTVVVLEDEVDYLSVTSEKSVYVLNETPDLSDLRLVITNKSGMTRTIKITQAMLPQGIDTSTAGEKSVTVSYGGFVAQYVYTVA